MEPSAGLTNRICMSGLTFLFLTKLQVLRSNRYGTWITGGIGLIPKLLRNMEWRLFFSALGIVFLSEMGDKTQITTLLLAGDKPMYVLWIALGSATALICCSFIEIMIGSEIIARFMKPRIISLLSAGAFITLGVLLLCGVLGNVQI